MLSFNHEYLVCRTDDIFYSLWCSLLLQDNVHVTTNIKSLEHQIPQNAHGDTKSL